MPDRHVTVTYTDPWDPWYEKAGRPMKLPPAWDLWEEHSCIEWNGDHQWVLTVEMGEAFVRCSNCQAEPFDSHQDSLNFGPLPVDVSVVPLRYDGPDGTEYDMEFDVTPKGCSC